jgi:hypothetical protein
MHCGIRYIYILEEMHRRVKIWRWKCVLASLCETSEISSIIVLPMHVFGLALINFFLLKSYFIWSFKCFVFFDIFSSKILRSVQCPSFPPPPSFCFTVILVLSFGFVIGFPVKGFFFYPPPPPPPRFLGMVSWNRPSFRSSYDSSCVLYNLCSSA